MFCDALPRRRARAEEHGPLVIFVPIGPSWPYYARPKRGARQPVTAADIRAVRARQRELVIPESFEWIEQTRARDGRRRGRGRPGGPAASADGARRRAAGAAAAGRDHGAASSRRRSRARPDLGRPGRGVRPSGHGRWPGGLAERDKIAADHDARHDRDAARAAAVGHSVLAAAFGPDGPVAAGSCQAMDDAAEITGVGVLPHTAGRASARRSPRCWPPMPRAGAYRPSSCPPPTRGGAHLRPDRVPRDRHGHDRRATPVAPRLTHGR